jgi:hypothetical protein
MGGMIDCLLKLNTFHNNPFDITIRLIQLVTWRKQTPCVTRLPPTTAKYILLLWKRLIFILNILNSLNNSSFVVFLCFPSSSTTCSDNVLFRRFRSGSSLLPISSETPRRSENNRVNTQSCSHDVELPLAGVDGTSPTVEVTQKKCLCF